MKKCSRCYKTKDEIYFQKDRSKKDGYGSACKECEHLRYLSRIDYNRKYYKEHRDLFRTGWLLWYKKNKNQYNASWEVGYYKRKGILEPKPCVVCGKLPVEAHHDNYLKRLQVIWLCREHHGELHRKNGEHYWELKNRVSNFLNMAI